MSGQNVHPRIKALFDLVDEDQSGYIDKDELDKMLELLHVPPEKKPELVQALDQDGDGQITLDEFAQAATAMGLVPSDSAQDDVRTTRIVGRALQIFDEIDVNGDGDLDEPELANVLLKFGVSDFEERRLQARAIMQQLDTDGDGTLTRSEFEEAARLGMLDGLIPDEDDDASNILRDDSDVVMSDRAATHTVTHGNKRPLPAKPQALSHIADEKYRRLWELFNVADDDGNGTINEDELRQLLSDRSLVHNVMGSSDIDITVSADQVHEVMVEIDEDGNGTLDFEEFCQAFEQLVDDEGAKNNVVRAQLRAVQRENAELKNSVKEQEALFNEMKRQLDLQLKAKDDQINELLEQLNNLQDGAADDARLASLSNQNAELADALSLATEKIREYADQVDSLEEELRQYRSSHEGFTTYGPSASELHNQIDELRELLESQETEYVERISWYQKQVSIAEIQLEELGATLMRIPELEDELAHLAVTNAELRTELEQLRGSGASAGGETIPIASMSEEELTKRISAMTSERLELLKNNKKLEKLFQEARAQTDEAKAEAQHYHSMYTELEESSRQEIEYLKTRVTELEYQVSELNVDLEELQKRQPASAQEHLNRARELLLSRDQTSEVLDQKTRALNEAQAQLADAEREIEDLRSQIAVALSAGSEYYELSVNELTEKHEIHKSELTQEIDQLRQRLEQQSSTYDEQLKSTEKELLQLREDKAAFGQAKVKELQDQLEKMRRELEMQSETRITEITAEHRQQLAELEGKLRAAQQEHEQAIDAINRDIEKERQEVQSKETVIKRLENELQDSRREKEEVTSQLEKEKTALQQSRLRLRQTQEEIEVLRADFERMSIARQQLEREKTEMISDVEALQQQRARMQSEMDQAQSKRQEAAKDYREQLADAQAKFQREIAEKTESIRMLTVKIEDTESELKRLQRQKQDHVAELQRQLERAEASHQQALQESKRVIEELRRRVSELEDSELVLKRQQEELKSQNEAEQQQKEIQLRSSLREHEQAQESVRSKLTTLQSELEAANQSRRQALEQFKATLAQKQEELEAMEGEKDEAVARLKAQLLEQRSDYEQKERSYQQTISELEDKIRELQSKLSALQEEMDKERELYRQRLSELQQQNASSQQVVEKTVTELKLQLEEKETLHHKELMDLQAEMAKLTAERDDATSALARAKESLKAAEAQAEEELKTLSDKVRQAEEERDRVVGEMSSKHQQQLEHIEELRVSRERLERESFARSAAPAPRAVVSESVSSDVVERLQKKLLEREKELEKLKATVERLTDETSIRLEEQDALFEAERGRFKVKLLDSQARIDVLQDSINRLEADRTESEKDLQRRLADKQALVDRLQRERDQLEAELRAQQAAADEAARQAESKYSSVVSQATLEQKMQFERLQAEQRRETQAKTAELLKSKQRELDDATRQHREDLSRLAAEYQTKLHEQRALLESANMTALQNMKERLQALELELSQALSERDQLREEYAASLAKARNAAQETQRKLEERIRELQEKIRRLEAEVEDHRTAHAEAQQTVELVKSEHHTQLVTMESKHQELLARSSRPEEGATKATVDESQLQRLRQEHELRVTELKSVHGAELGSAQARLEQAQANLKDAEKRLLSLEEERTKLLSRLDEAADDSRRKINSMADEMSDLRRQVQDRETRIAELESIIDSLKSERDGLRAELDVLGQRLPQEEREEYERQISDLERRVLEYEAVLQSLRGDAERVEARKQVALQEQQALFDAERDVLNGTISSLNGRIGELEDELDGLRQRLLALDRDHARLQEQHRQAKEVHEAVQREVMVNASARRDTDLRADTELQHRQKLEAAALEEQRLKEAAEERAAFADKLQQKAEKIAELQTQLAAAQAEVARLNNALAAKAAELEETESLQAAALAKANQRVQMLQAQLDELAASGGNISASFESRLQEQQSTYAASIAERDANIAKLRSKLEDATRRLEQALLDKEALERDKDAEHALHTTKMQDEIRELQAQIHDHRAHIEEQEVVRATMEQQQRTRSEAVMEDVPLRASVPDDGAESKYATLHAHVEQLRRELKTAQDDRDAAARQFKDRLKTLQADYDQQLASKQAASLELSSKVKQLTRLVESLQRDKEDMQQKLATLEARQESSAAGAPQSGASRARLAALEQQLAESELAADNYRLETARLRTQLHELQVLLAANKTDMAASQANLRSQVTFLRGEVERLVGERDRNQSAFARRTQEMSARVKAAMEEREALLARFADAESSRLKHKADAHRATRQQEALERETASLRSQTARHMQARTTMEETMVKEQQVRSAVGCLEQSVGSDVQQAQLRRKVAQLEQTMEELQDELARTTSQANDARAKQTELRHELDITNENHTAAMDRLNEQLRAERLKSHELDSELALALSERDSLTRRISALQREITVQAENHAAVASRLASSTGDIPASVREEISNLRLSVEEARSAANTLRMQNERLKQQLDDRESLLASVRPDDERSGFGLLQARVKQLEEELDRQEAQHAKERERMQVELAQSLASLAEAKRDLQLASRPQPERMEAEMSVRSGAGEYIEVEGSATQSLREQLKQSDQQIAQLRVERDQLQNALASSLSDEARRMLEGQLQRSFAERTEAADRFQAIVDDLRRQLEQASRQKNVVVNENTLLREELTEFEAMLRTQRGKGATLPGNDTNVRRATTDGRLHQLERELSGLEAERDSLRAQLKRRDERMAALEADKDEQYRLLRQRIIELEQELLDAVRRHESSQVYVQEHLSEVVRTAGQQAAPDPELRRLRSQLEASQSEVNVLRTKLEVVQDAGPVPRKHLDRIHQLEIELAAARRDREMAAEEFSRQLDELQTRLETSQKDRAALFEQFELLSQNMKSKTVHSNVTTIHKRDNRIKQLEMELSAALRDREAAADEFNAQLRDLQRELQDARRERDMMAEQFSSRFQTIKPRDMSTMKSESASYVRSRRYEWEF